MDRERFIERYGGVYERSPWVAARTWDRLGGAPQEDRIAAELEQTVEEASEDEQLALLRAHPELAARAREAVTQASADEQASAGLDHCSPAEAEEFTRLNAAYRQRFGFPFIMAVRGASVGEILATFRRRLGRDLPSEFGTAIAEVHRIARARLGEAS